MYECGKSIAPVCWGFITVNPPVSDKNTLEYVEVVAEMFLQQSSSVTCLVFEYGGEFIYRADSKVVVRIDIFGSTFQIGLCGFCTAVVARFGSEPFDSSHSAPLHNDAAAMKPRHFCYISCCRVRMTCVGLGQVELWGNDRRSIWQPRAARLNFSAAWRSPALARNACVVDGIKSFGL